MSLLRIEDLSLELGGKSILNHVTWESEKAASGLLGPNGAGKSTLFRCVMNLQSYEKGQIYFEGKDLKGMNMGSRRRAGIAYLAQEHWLFHKLSARDNLKAVGELIGSSLDERKLDELLEKVGLVERREHLSSTLSGGEKRRLEIARVLMEEPKLIMMDEPFAGLDPKAIRLLKALLTELMNDGIHLLISDHQVDHILEICEEVTLMNHGEIALRSTSEEFKQKEGAKTSYL